MKILLTILYLLFLTTACTTLPKSKILTMKQEKKTTIGEVSVEFKQQVLTGTPEHLKKEVTWGERTDSPIKRPHSLTVKIATTNTTMKYSAFSDLFNVSKLGISEENGNVVVLMEGGGSSTYYKAKIFFDKQGFLLKRYVYSPAFQDEVFEETNYSFIRRTDM